MGESVASLGADTPPDTIHSRVLPLSLETLWVSWKEKPFPRVCDWLWCSIGPWRLDFCFMMQFLLYDLHCGASWVFVFWFFFCNVENLLCIGGDDWRCVLCGWGFTQREWHPRCSDRADGPQDDGALSWSRVSPRRTHQGEAVHVLFRRCHESKCWLVSLAVSHCSLNPG